jgi:hypothetical protein
MLHQMLADSIAPTNNPHTKRLLPSVQGILFDKIQ